MQYRRARVAGATYFFAVVVVGRRPLFRDLAAVQSFNTAVTEVRARHAFSIDAQVILPDHIHALWTLPEGDADFPMRWRLIKSTFTRAWLANHPAHAISPSRHRKGEQGIWQRRYWEHLIRNELEFQAFTDYIHYNPVHHKLVTAPCDWPFSTFHEFVQRGVYDAWWGSDTTPPLPD